jgi:hypothetical protein
MITRIVIMRPGAANETGSVDLPEPPSYRDLDRVLRPLLDGGDLDHVVVYTGAEPFLGEHAYRDMFVDEVGHEKNLPRNEAATTLYLRNCRLHAPEKPDDPDYFIVGPAVLFVDRRVWS